MKNYTKKQFEKSVFKVIEELNNEELEVVRKGLYTLYNVLKLNTDCLKFEKLNALSAFFHDITYITANETMKRIKKEEVPY